MSLSCPTSWMICAKSLTTITPTEIFSSFSISICMLTNYWAFRQSICQHQFTSSCGRNFVCIVRYCNLKPWTLMGSLANSVSSRFSTEACDWFWSWFFSLPCDNKTCHKNSILPQLSFLLERISRLPSALERHVPPASTCLHFFVVQLPLTRTLKHLSLS